VTNSSDYKKIGIPGLRVGGCFAHYIFVSLRPDGPWHRTHTHTKTIRPILLRLKIFNV